MKEPTCLGGSRSRSVAVGVLNPGSAMALSIPLSERVQRLAESVMTLSRCYLIESRSRHLERPASGPCLQ